MVLIYLSRLSTCCGSSWRPWGAAGTRTALQSTSSSWACRGTTGAWVPGSSSTWWAWLTSARAWTCTPCPWASLRCTRNSSWMCSNRWACVGESTWSYTTYLIFTYVWLYLIITCVWIIFRPGKVRPQFPTYIFHVPCLHPIQLRRWFELKFLMFSLAVRT